MAVLTSDGRTNFELNSEQKYKILVETEKLDELAYGNILPWKWYTESSDRTMESKLYESKRYQ